MIEKLLENWLDNASERSYQPVFVQMLAARGYTVLHSTRHCLLEYGKDILAIAPDGVGCAFQLKGDPKGQMTVGQFRSEIQPQLVQLLAQAPSYPGFPSGPHRAYLVSNGQFSEEVQVAVAQMNAAPYPAKLELWSRGTLLDMCKSCAAALWPSELSDNRALLDLYMADRRDQLPIEVLGNMLSSILALADSSTRLKTNEFVRSASSALWATGISLSSFAEANNHQAMATGWALCHSMLLAAAAKHTQDDTGLIAGELALSNKAVLDALAALWEEVSDRDHLVQGNPMTDRDVYGWRITTLYGLFSVLYFADLELQILDFESRVKLKKWLCGDRKPHLWSEAAVAQLIPLVFALTMCDNNERARELLVETAKLVVTSNQQESPNALATPHYSIEQVLREQSGVNDRTSSQPHERESFSGASYTAVSLIQLMAASGLKDSCVELWPDFTKLCHRAMCLEQPWHYCLLRATQGTEETRIYPSTYQWTQLQSDVSASLEQGRSVIKYFPMAWQLLMWWQIAPHRLNASSAIAAHDLLQTLNSPSA